MLTATANVQHNIVLLEVEPLDDFSGKLGHIGCRVLVLLKQNLDAAPIGVVCWAYTGIPVILAVFLRSHDEFSGKL